MDEPKTVKKKKVNKPDANEDIKAEGRELFRSVYADQVSARKSKAAAQAKLAYENYIKEFGGE